MRCRRTAGQQEGVAGRDLATASERPDRAQSFAGWGRHPVLLSTLFACRLRWLACWLRCGLSDALIYHLRLPPLLRRGLRWDGEGGLVCLPSLEALQFGLGQDSTCVVFPRRISGCTLDRAALP